MKKKMTASAAIGVLLVVCSAQTAAAAPSDDDASLQRITGSVAMSDGRKAPAGTEVQILAWPNSAALARLAPGDRIETQVVGTATVDARGGFTAQYVAPKEDSRFHEGEWVNISARSFVDGTMATTHTSIPADGGRTTSSSERWAAEHLTLTAPISDPAIQRSEVTPMATSCWDEIETTKDHLATVGRVYLQKPGSSATFTYKTGASNTIGVGISASGATGTWSLSGTNKVTSTGTAGFGKRTTNTEYQTEFRFQRIATKCSTAAGQVIVTGKIFRAAVWNGGAVTVTGPTTPSVPDTHCTPYSAGGWQEKVNTTAATVSGGAKTSGSIGINLSSTSGYSTSAAMRVDFTSAGRLCGTLGKPAATPGFLISKS